MNTTPTLTQSIARNYTVRKRPSTQPTIRVKPDVWTQSARRLFALGFSAGIEEASWLTAVASTYAYLVRHHHNPSEIGHTLGALYREAHKLADMPGVRVTSVRRIITIATQNKTLVG